MTKPPTKSASVLDIDVDAKSICRQCFGPIPDFAGKDGFCGDDCMHLFDEQLGGSVPDSGRCYSCGVEGVVGEALFYASGDEVHCESCYQELLKRPDAEGG